MPRVLSSVRASMRNILKEIEGKHPVDTIVVNGEQIWPYVRLVYYSAYVRRTVSRWGEGQRGSSLPRMVANMVKNSFYGFCNWFGRYDYVALSNTTERKMIGGKYFNKLLDPMIDALGGDRVLYVEAPGPTLYPLRRVHTRSVVCRDLVTLLGETWGRFMLKGCVIQNGSLLHTIQKDYDLHIGDVRKVRSFDGQRRAFSMLFRRIKPKAVLLSNYSGYMPAVKAARDLGITVVEFQHGAISREHEAYNVYAPIDRTYFPDYLLVFGKRDLETFDNPRFIKHQNIYPVGSFYIEHIRKNYKPEPGLIRQLGNYKRSVGVTLQWTAEKRAIEFVCQAAQLDGTIMYILIPRKPEEEHYSTLSLPPNVMVVKDKNFYELMMYVDFHSTIYSSCAEEAPSLGVQNILINVDNLSRQHYGSVLNDGRITRFVDTPGEFVDAINGFEKLDRDTIVKLNEQIIAANYEDNIRRFIETVLCQ